MTGPLSGVRVLDLTWVLAGPYCTRILADLGADVIKVQSRATSADNEGNESAYFLTWNRDKRGITLNLGTPRGIDLARSLVSKCDLVVENFSPRVLPNWGLDYETLRASRADVILVSLSGMGQTGPWRDHVSFGPTLQALAGFTALMAEPGRDPAGFGISYADHATGLMAALATVAALHQRDATGAGQHIDISQFESLVSMLGPALLDASANRHFPAPTGNTAPYGEARRGVYRCAGDDRWLAVSLSTPEHDDGVRRALGRPDLAAGDLEVALQAWTAERSAGEAMAALQAEGVPAGVVQRADDLVDRDLQLAERGFFVAAPHPSLGEIRADAFPVLFGDTPPEPRRVAPALGRDSDAVFRDLLGLTPEEITRLQAERVIW